jgi:hypothetical protein
MRKRCRTREGALFFFLFAERRLPGTRRASKRLRFDAGGTVMRCIFFCF